MPYKVPSYWLTELDILTGRVELLVAGYPVSVDLTARDLEQVYLPLLARLATRAEAEGRLLAGLAGIPGGGKSTFAAVLSHVATHVLGPDTLIVVGMDGWHYPNAVLDRRTTRGVDGRDIALQQRKGSPESLDVESLVNALNRLRTTDASVSLPVYDRTVHEPIPDALSVPPETRIILVEGNYLLMTQPPWDRVAERLSPKLFLDCAPDVARERVIARHIRGGLTVDQAADKFERNDELNTETVRSTAINADHVIRL